MRLVARRQKVGRDIAFGGDVGHDFDFFVDLWQFGEELCSRVAFQQVFGDRVACVQRIFQALHVGIVQEDLCLHYFRSLRRDTCVIAQRQIQKDGNGRATFHVGQQFKGELDRDLCDLGLTQNDVLQKTCFCTRGARGAWQGVIDKEIQRVFAMFITRVFDLSN